VLYRVVISRLSGGIFSLVEILPTGTVREIVRVFFFQLPADGSKCIFVWQENLAVSSAEVLEAWARVPSGSAPERNN